MILSILALLLGVLFIYRQPMAKYGMPKAAEIGLGTVLILLFLFYVIGGYLIPKLADDDLRALPCYSDSLEMRCYNISSDSCSSIWASYKTICDREIKQAADTEHPSLLLGTQINTCVRKSYDKSLKSTRRFTEDSGCIKLFRAMDSLM